jgi:hypothetical protein
MGIKLLQHYLHNDSTMVRNNIIGMWQEGEGICWSYVLVIWVSMTTICNHVFIILTKIDTTINKNGTCWFGSLTKTRSKEDESSFLISL